MLQEKSVAAQNGSPYGKVSVVRGISAEGYEQYYYYAWNDNVCASFNGYEASWFPGIYDIPQSSSTSFHIAITLIELLSREIQ